MFKFPRRGRYSGRLAFDPDTGFHIDPDGRKLVTPDAGASWVYARRGDPSHISRYQRAVKVFDGTTGEDLHHYNPTPDDPHVNGLVFLPDPTSETATSHTGAPRG